MQKKNWLFSFLHVTMRLMSDTNINDVLSRLLFEHNLTITSLARAINLPQPTLHRIANGQSRNPHMSTLLAVADYFDISVDQLRGKQPLYGTATMPSDWQLVPVIDKAIVTTWPAELTAQQPHTYTDVPVGKNAFAMSVEDSTMQPIFAKGTQLIIDPDKPVTDRCFVAVKLANYPEATFRQLMVNLNTRYIKPLNPDLEQFEAIPLDEEKDKIIGVLVQARQNFE